MFQLLQDGKLKGEFGTENAALAWLQKNYFSSWDYAFKHGGWKMVEIEKDDEEYAAKGYSEQGGD